MHHGNGTRTKIRGSWLAATQEEGGTKVAAEGASRIGVRIVLPTRVGMVRNG